MASVYGPLTDLCDLKDQDGGKDGGAGGEKEKDDRKLVARLVDTVV